MINFKENQKPDSKKLDIIQARANELFKDSSTINGAICFGAKHLGLRVSDACDRLGFTKANGLYLLRKFEKESSYQDVKDLIIHCTKEIYRL